MSEARHPLKALSAAVLGTVLAVSACAGDEPAPAARPTPSSTSSTTTTPPPPPAVVTGKGLPADLLAALRPLYLGGKVAATPAPAKYLAGRKAGTQSVVVAGRTGTWKKVPIAVVTRGKDVTLLVKSGGWKVVGGWWPSLGLPQRTPAPTARVLAIGSDARPNQKVDKARADSLHIIGVDAKGVGGVVGIPRDSWVTLNTGRSDKINAALVYGGAKGQVASVQRATGVKIDGYVMTGFKGFRGMVNGMGGITFVSKSVLKRSVDGVTLLRIGKNLLKGEPALSVARERKSLPNGDFGRSHNQGKLILAGMTMAKAGGPGAVPKYLTAMSPHVTTDLSTDRILNLAAAVYFTDPKKVPNKVVPGGIGTRGGGQSVVLLGAGARSVFADIKDGRLGR